MELIARMFGKILLFDSCHSSYWCYSWSNFFVLYFVISKFKLKFSHTINFLNFF
jgi:hypothetical protein